MADPQKITYLGQVDYRNKSLTFGIKEKDRTRHMYIIGKTGMGKSTLLSNLAVQDIRNGEGICVIDPHGSFAEELLEYIPKERLNDVIYFAPFDTDYPLGLNVLEKVDISKRHLVANGLMSAFKKIFGEERFSDRIQYILNNIILALLENENESLLGVNRMLIDKEYRKFIISNVKDPSVRSFWLEEFVKAGDKYQQEAAPGIQNKIGQFISNPLIRNIIGQQRTSFDIRQIMDNKKILIVNLSKGKVGEGNANLIGSLLITKIYLAAMSRADAGIHELEKLPPFYFYVDEFQNFANESFANILSEARKYNLALTVAHQYVEQMTDEVKAAVFGNVGSMVVFRVGATDAEIFEKEFAPYFILDDIVNLGFTQIYLRLMIDGVGSKPFSAKTLGPIKRPAESYVAEILAHTRNTYAKKVTDAEDEIKGWYEPRVAPPKSEAKAEGDKGVSLSQNGDAVSGDMRRDVRNASQIEEDRRIDEDRRDASKLERSGEGRREAKGEKKKTNSSPISRYDTTELKKVDAAATITVPQVALHVNEHSVTRDIHEDNHEYKSINIANTTNVSHELGAKEKKEERFSFKREQAEPTLPLHGVRSDEKNKEDESGGVMHKSKENVKNSSLKEALAKALEEKKVEDMEKEKRPREKELLAYHLINEDKKVDVSERENRDDSTHQPSKKRNEEQLNEISEDVLKPLVEETPL